MSDHGDGIEEEASSWVVRHDRGLSARESDEFEEWLRTDARHEEAWKLATGVWDKIDHEVIQSDLPVPAAKSRHWSRWAASGLAAAAAIALAYVGLFAPERAGPGSPDGGLARVEGPLEPRVVRLSDGTTVFLKDGSQVIERFTQSERRVLLLNGEAHFAVAKNAAWPFIVRAGSVEVRAVGTAFNVLMQPDAVEVRVTEGQVSVDQGQRPGDVRPAAGKPLVSAGQRAVVDLTPAPGSSVQVSTMDAAELARTVAWQEPLLRLSDYTLERLVAEVERRTDRRVVLADPELKDIQLGGKLEALNIEQLSSYLELGYGITSERTPEGGLILHKAR